MNLPLKEFEATERPQPQVFVRAIVTPPGAPWEQTRAAKLEARLGAPLPIADLMHQVRRLSKWSPGRPGRFAVFYLRAQEYREPFETSVEVDGQSLRVGFGTPVRQMEQLRLAGLVLLVCVLSGAILGGGVTLALRARAEATARLEAAEALAADRLKTAEAFRERSERARDLRALAGFARPLDEVVGDLTWVATSKTPEARIVGVHWERGLLAVEARGEQPPFLAVDRPLERSAKPLRSGVWLWAVGSRRAGAALARGAYAAEIGP